jgi:hypothetical protein
MTAVLTALVLAITGIGLDLPPEIDTAAVATATAVRVEVPPPAPVEDVAAPPPPAAPSGMINCDEMSWYRQRAGLPARFDALGWRESNCRNEDAVHTSCCHGWWQLNVGLHLRDHRLAGRYHQCGVYSYADVNSDTPGDKLRQACAAKALYDVVGFSAWATS